MKRFVIAMALACALSGSTLAGEIHTAGAPAPGDPPPPGDMGDPPGDIGNGGNQGSGGLADDGNLGNGTLAVLILDLLF